MDAPPFINHEREVPCAQCGHTITEYEPIIGLMPVETRPNGSWSSHSNLVCELRRELNVLKKKRDVLAKELDLLKGTKS